MHDILSCPDCRLPTDFCLLPYEGFLCSKIGANTGTVCTRIPYMCTHVSMYTCFHVCTKLVAGKPSRRRQGEDLQSEPANLCLKARFHCDILVRDSPTVMENSDRLLIGIFTI